MHNIACHALQLRGGILFFSLAAATVLYEGVHAETQALLVLFI